MSTLNVTQIKNPDASTPAITLNTDGTADFALSSLSGGPLAGFRNAVINGNFDFWERGTSQTAAGYGSADRWFNYIQGSACTLSRQAFTLGQTAVPGEPTYYMRAGVTSASGASNYAYLQHRVEGVRTFAGQQGTLSFWAKADASKNIAVELAQYFGSGGTPSTIVHEIGVTKLGLTTSWQKITVTATMPSIAGKTLGTDGDDSLRLNIWLDAGSSFNSRTDTLGQQSGTFDIARVQLEPGPIATQFERRPVAAERTLCERYYQRGGIVLVSNWPTSYPCANWHTRMRAVPTLSYTANTGTGATLAAISSDGYFQNGNHSAPSVASVFGDAEL